MKRILLLCLPALLFLSCSGEEFDIVTNTGEEGAFANINMIFNNIPDDFEGDSLYVFTLDNQDAFFSAQITSAVEDGELTVRVPEGQTAFSIIAYVPSVSEWSIEEAFDAGAYSSITGVTERSTTYITDSWEVENNYASTGATGAQRALSVGLELNNSTDAGQEFDQGEILDMFADVNNNLIDAIQSVSFSVDGTEIQTVSEEPYSINYNTIDLAAGEHTASVTVTNENNITVSDELAFLILTEQNEAPQVNISGIADDFTFDRQTRFTLNSNVTDADGSDDIDRVEFIINGTTVATVTEAPYSYEWDSFDNQVGDITIEVRAFDQAGASRSDFVNGTLTEPDNYWPRVTITGPNNGDSFSIGDIITITASANDQEGDPISQVNFSVDGTLINIDANDPYETTYDTSLLQAGEYVIEARVFSSIGGNSADTITITIVE